MSGKMTEYTNLLYLLKNTLPNSYNIYLFDLTAKSYPVAAKSENRHPTEKAARDMVKQIMASDELVERGMLSNIPLQQGDAELVKGSVFLVKDDGRAVGALCICLPVNNYLELESILSSVLTFNITDDYGSIENSVDEVIPKDETIEETVTRVIETYGVEPARMNQDEKLELMCDLYDTGVFFRKGAVAVVADAISMSEQSVYRYVAKIKKARK